jgi:hypothetical protein
MTSGMTSSEPFRQRLLPVLTRPLALVARDPDEVKVIVQAILGRFVRVRWYSRGQQWTISPTPVR